MEREKIVGTLVGESTSKEFRLAVTPEAIREQDIIAVDATLNETEESARVRRNKSLGKGPKNRTYQPSFSS